MNTIDLKNRTAIVTGGARGIGFAIAKRMLQPATPCALVCVGEGEILDEQQCRCVKDK